MADETQKEEQQVLESIWGTDGSLTALGGGKFEVKVAPPSEDDADKKEYLLLGFAWGPNYPQTEAPTFTIRDVPDTSCLNYKLDAAAREKIIGALKAEAASQLGMQMMFGLVEGLRARFDELVTASLNAGAQVPKAMSADASLWETVGTTQRATGAQPAAVVAAAAKEAPKEKLTKAQKRRQGAHLDSKGERPRGWNWVDVISHLSRTGGSEKS